MGDNARPGLAEMDSGVANTILHIGEPDFPDRLMRTLTRVAGVDHCMVFGFSVDGAADWLMTAGGIETAPELGRAYAGHFHAADPNKDVILGAVQEAGPIALPFVEARMYPAAYRRLFFQSSGIVDKYATALWHGGTCFYVNFYRTRASGRFSEAALTRLRQAGPTIGAAVGRHLSVSRTRPATDLRDLIKRSIRLRALTPRECDVCADILRGFSSEAIAARLGISVNSVLTYRRRAYERLGITAQNELFGLVLESVVAVDVPATRH